MFLPGYYSNYFLIGSQLNSIIKKSITFSTEVKVILIPSRKELFDANLYNELWWSKKDFIRFKIESFDEMTKMKKKHFGITREEVLKLLYQPGNISFNESNF